MKSLVWLPRKWIKKGKPGPEHQVGSPLVIQPLIPAAGRPAKYSSELQIPEGLSSSWTLLRRTLYFGRIWNISDEKHRNTERKRITYDSSILGTEEEEIREIHYEDASAGSPVRPLRHNLEFRSRFDTDMMMWAY